MSHKTVYITLSQFCETDDTPRKMLIGNGYKVLENKMGRRIQTEEMFAALKDVDAVLAAVEPYTEELLSKLPKLKCISRCGIGVDAIDLKAAKKYGKEVLVTRDEIVEPVAQMTLGMIFSLARNFIPHKYDFQEGHWKKRTGVLLSEWTIGLIGFGQIGKRVEKYLKPFGPKILVTDPYLQNKDFGGGIEQCSLDDLLARSDLVSLHAASKPNDGPLLGKAEFAKMKKGSFFVNTARGYMVDEKALEESIQLGILAGAALDVFEEEPYHGSLAKYPNVLLTPHVGTLTSASRMAMELKCAQNVIDFFARLEKQ